MVKYMYMQDIPLIPEQKIGYSDEREGEKVKFNFHFTLNPLILSTASTVLL